MLLDTQLFWFWILVEYNHIVSISNQNSWVCIKTFLVNLSKSWSVLNISRAVSEEPNLLTLKKYNVRDSKQKYIVNKSIHGFLDSFSKIWSCVTKQRHNRWFCKINHACSHWLFTFYYINIHRIKVNWIK